MKFIATYIWVVLLIYMSCCDLTSGLVPKGKSKMLVDRYGDTIKMLDEHIHEKFVSRKDSLPDDPSQNVFQESPELNSRLQNMKFTRDDKQNQKLINPSFQVVYAGSSVSVTCISHGEKTWSKYGEKLSPKYLTESNDLIIPKAFEIHSGIYTCAGITHNNQPFEEDAIVLVGDEMHSLIEPPLYEGLVGDSVQFNCNQGKNVFWFHEKFSSYPVSYPISSGPSLKFEHMNNSDNGNFFCFGQYLDLPRHFLSVSPVQLYDPKQVHPVKTIIHRGEDAEFYCQARNPIWYKVDKYLPVSVGRILSFKSAVHRDNGYYTCKGKYDNTDEEFTARVQLVVLNKPEWPEYFSSGEGEKVFFPTYKKMSDKYEDAATNLKNFLHHETNVPVSEKMKGLEKEKNEKYLEWKKQFESVDKPAGKLQSKDTQAFDKGKLAKYFEGKDELNPLGKEKKVRTPGRLNIKHFEAADRANLVKLLEGRHELKPDGNQDQEKQSASSKLQCNFVLCIIYALSILAY